MTENDNNRPRVGIGLPTYNGHYYPDMKRCLNALVKKSHLSGIDVMTIEGEGSDLPQLRNKIVTQALQNECTHLFFIDSDMVFPDDGLLKLLKHDRDIISGLCVMRAEPHTPVAKKVDENGQYYVPYDYTEGRFYSDLDSVGGAFLLIKTDVLRKMESPWFAMPEYMGATMSEDIYFCKKAKGLGYDICLDSSLVIGHIGQYIYTIHDYEPKTK